MKDDHTTDITQYEAHTCVLSWIQVVKGFQASQCRATVYQNTKLNHESVNTSTSSLFHNMPQAEIWEKEIEYVQFSCFLLTVFNCLSAYRNRSWHVIADFYF